MRYHWQGAVEYFRLIQNTLIVFIRNGGDQPLKQSKETVSTPEKKEKKRICNHYVTILAVREVNFLLK